MKKRVGMLGRIRLCSHALLHIMSFAVRDAKKMLTKRILLEFWLTALRQYTCHLGKKMYYLGNLRRYMDKTRRPVTLRVPTELWAACKEVASANDISLTELCEGFIKEGIKRKTHLPGTTYLMPEVTDLLETQLKLMEDRFARLLARTAIEAGTTKRLLMDFVVATDNASREEIDEAHEIAWALAHKALKRPLESIEDLVKNMPREER